MIDFELTEEQKALIDTARRFAKERIIPIAAECDREVGVPEGRLQGGVGDRPREPDASRPSTAAPGLGELDNAMITEELAYGCTGIQTSMTREHARRSRRSSSPAARSRRRSTSAGSRASRSSRQLRDDRARRRQRRRRACSAALGSRRRRLRAHRHEVLDHEREPRARSTSSSRPTNPRAAGTRASARSSSIATRKGLSVGKHEDKLGQRASDTRSVMLDDVHVPTAQRPRARRARASSSRWRPSTRRAPTSARSPCGLMRRCLDESVAYAKERKTFGVADRAAPARAGDDRRDGDPHRGDAPARAQGRVEPRQGRPRSDRRRAYAKAFGADARCRRRSTRCRSSAATAT